MSKLSGTNSPIDFFINSFFSSHVLLIRILFEIGFSNDNNLGSNNGEDPPLPIPNREVKLTCADGTAFIVGE